MPDDYEPELELDDEIEIEDADEGDADEGEVSDDGSEETGGQEAAEGEEVEHEQVRRPSRAQARVEQALREAREAKDELARLRSERASSETTAQRQQADAQERERVANMGEAERLEYLIGKQAQAHRTEIQQMRFELQDSADKTAFEGLCTRSPVAHKLASEVEARLAELRRGGTTAPRETVLKYLIGERALANAGKAKGKAQRAADAAKARQVARPGASRGDVSGEGRRSGTDAAARAKRLENMQI